MKLILIITLGVIAGLAQLFALTAAEAYGVTKDETDYIFSRLASVLAFAILALASGL